ncbi:glycosyltransferase [Bacillus sp. FJAT-45350]|uniref:glycosyltransferase n=1 Tax=Bacillus sp. FJAT-45350 TaxID=2011014 RepID=UPI000BB72283|nr:glycosyltransferase [Bacillus sp. FJAT-45350]
MGDYRLSANIIVRNAEETIDACLQSIQDIVDEIVVIDTGSTDDTLEKLKKYSVDLYTCEWKDDFSEARNKALEFSTGDWVFIIDADETLQAQRRTLEEMMSDSKVEAYWVTVENFLSTNHSHSNSQQNIRMFRNNKEYRYEGRIHEQIASSILRIHPRNTLQESNLTIKHYGDLPYYVEKYNKNERNRFIIELALEEEPNHPFYLYNLAVEYMKIKEYEKVVNNLTICIKKENKKATYLPHAYLLLATAKLKTRDFNEVLDFIELAIKRYPDYTDLYYLKAQILADGYRYEQALVALYKTIELGGAPKKYISTKGVGTFLSHYEVGKIYKKKGFTKEAMQRFILCVQINPKVEKAYELIAECLIELNATPHEVLEQFNKISTLAGICFFLIAKALCRIGKYEEAIPLLRKIKEEDLAVMSLQNECLMQTGQCMEALQIQRKALKRIEKEHFDSEEWLIKHLCCFWSEDLPVPYTVSKHVEFNPHSNWLILIISLLEEEDTDKQYPIPEEKVAYLFEWLLHYGFTDVGERIMKRLKSINFLSVFTKTLYRKGYVMKAAERFIQLLELGQLDDEGTFYLAEIMYDRSQYEYAIALFEEALEKNPDNWRARQGAALSYLAEGLKWAVESRAHYPYSEWLGVQIQEIKVSIQLLNEVDWHTKWTYRQRRNAKS